jgi:Zn-dependent protease
MIGAPTERHGVSSTDPVEGGRPLLRGRILGFPVHLDLSFVVIMGLLGYYPGATGSWIVLWLLITPLAVLTHELGHAVLARAAGAKPEIALAGFGGVTTFTPPGPLSRVRSLGISLAGPFVGLAIGGVLWVGWLATRDNIVDGSWQHQAFQIGLLTCLGWSVLNLLPILPLDGGQAMRELLPGAPAVRERRAMMVSVVTAAVVAVLVYAISQNWFLTLFLVFFGVTNVLGLRQTSARPAARPAADPPAATPEQAVIELLWRSDPVRARELLSSLPPSVPVDLAVRGAVQALTQDRAQGHALLDQEVARRPGDANAAALLVLTLTLEHDWDAVIAAIQGPLGPSIPPVVLERAITEARGVGREDVAGRLTLLAQRPAT